jgi:hypothetical protein
MLSCEDVNHSRWEVIFRSFKNAPHQIHELVSALRLIPRQPANEVPLTNLATFFGTQQCKVTNAWYDMVLREYGISDTAAKLARACGLPSALRAPRAHWLGDLTLQDIADNATDAHGRLKYMLMSDEELLNTRIDLGESRVCPPCLVTTHWRLLSVNAKTVAHVSDYSAAGWVMPLDITIGALRDLDRSGLCFIVQSLPTYSLGLLTNKQVRELSVGTWEHRHSSVDALLVPGRFLLESLGVRQLCVIAAGSADRNVLRALPAKFWACYCTTNFLDHNQVVHMDAVTSHNLALIAPLELGRLLQYIPQDKFKYVTPTQWAGINYHEVHPNTIPRLSASVLQYFPAKHIEQCLRQWLHQAKLDTLELVPVTQMQASVLPHELLDQYCLVI